MTKESDVQLCTSGVCIAIAFYFAENKNGAVAAKKKIEALTKNINVTEINEETVQQTLQNKRIPDVEDGLEYYSASEAGCTLIVTEDTNDFYFATMEVANARNFLQRHVFGGR